MAQFPCPRERIAASALLLLSNKPPAMDASIFDFKDEDSIEETSKLKSCLESLISTDSKSCASSNISSLSQEEVSASPTRIFTVVPRRNEMRLKVIRKSRSKIHKSSSRWKFSSGGSGMTSSVCGSGSGSISTETSCLSSSCSWDSSARSRQVRGAEALGRTNVGSAYIRRRADGILNFLSDGSCSEVRIRQLLGDSPDTSKALRMLLKLGEVKRSGTGGRQDPYIYKVASQI